MSLQSRRDARRKSIRHGSSGRSRTAGPVAQQPGNPLLFTQVLSAHHPDVLRAFRRRSPADSAVGSSAPPGAHAPPPAPPPYPSPGAPVAFLNATGHGEGRVRGVPNPQTNSDSIKPKDLQSKPEKHKRTALTFS